MASFFLKMWYTALVTFDLFLVSWLHITFATHWIITVIALVIYYLVQLPESTRFKHWDGWRWVRAHWFHTRIYVPSAAGGWSVVRDIERDWEPPHRRGQVIYAVAPHSVYAENVTITMVLNALFEGVAAVSTSLLFWLPVAREFASLAGAHPATSHAISELLDKGRSIIITPEGMRGALHLNEVRGWRELLRQRKGFVRLALTCKSWRTLCIIPVYHGGAERLYDVWIPWRWMQGKLLNKFYYPWPILHLGWYGTCLPKQRQLCCYYGTPIPLSTDNGRTVRGVDEVHADYCAAMEKMASVHLKLNPAF